MSTRSFWLLAAALAAVPAAGPGCSAERGGDDDGSDADADGDADGDSDSDTETETETDTGTGNPAAEFSYIWISNTGEGTLSKVDTLTGVEVGRFLTGPYGSSNDPSRTSVNMYGDMVVTNRDPWTGPSSVTKFVARSSDCYDRDNDGVVDTSSGPSDVLPWGVDECMLWNTTFGSGYSVGARATAWDGNTDPVTGAGGAVWVGTCNWGTSGNTVFKLDGDSGDILESLAVPLGCAYGGAMDGTGGFWIYDSSGGSIVRIDTGTLHFETHAVPCGYGISVDSQGRVWTGGWGSGEYSCINRYDPLSNQNQYVNVPGASFLRGIAVGIQASAGYVWAADTGGSLVKVDLETVQVAGMFSIGGSDMIGVAIDFEGNVWTVAQGSNSAYKFDPETETHQAVPIGMNPYTYSDMTGAQLKNVIDPE
jgi:hypothetical protein